MEIKEVIEMSKRDYKLEKVILNSFSSILKGYVTKSEIERRMEENCTNGIYLLEPNVFDQVKHVDNLQGFYDSDDKVIMINALEYKQQPNIAIHELGHAFLNEKNRTIIEILGSKVEYGKGLEEGAVQVLSEVKRVNNLNIKTTSSYVDQVRLFLQLNHLYKKVIKEYPNLLIHILKSEESFCKLTRKIYEEIIKDDTNLVLRSALAVVSGSDISIETDEFVDEEIMMGINLINSIYLSIIDSNFRNRVVKNPLFIYDDILKLTDEERLLHVIFGEGIKDGYYDRMKFSLSEITRHVSNLSEDYQKKFTRI